MREIEGVNELHKSNTEYNKGVVEVIGIASKAKEPRDVIDILGKGKKLRDIELKDEKKEIELLYKSDGGVIIKKPKKNVEKEEEGR